jgi:hypothetical protein
MYAGLSTKFYVLRKSKIKSGLTRSHGEHGEKLKAQDQKPSRRLSAIASGDGGRAAMESLSRSRKRAMTQC